MSLTLEGPSAAATTPQPATSGPPPARPHAAAPTSSGSASLKTPVSPPPSSSRPTTRAGSRRDPAIDLVRFACLVVVVVLHSLMSAAVLGPDGSVVPTVALSRTTGFAIASWLFQIMPLFFVIGGCAGIISWRRIRAEGGSWGAYLRARLRRLVVPVTVLIGFTGLGLSVASGLGAPSELVTEASHRIGQPLWFLAVYVGLTALVPLGVHFHERAPRRSLAVLTAAVIVVDGLVAVTGVHGLGYVNFVLVWPLVQQLGFFYADALDRPVRRLHVWSGLVTALSLLVGLVAAGVYSPNMLVNLNPPTGALVLLGVVQICGLRLVHSRLSAMLTGAGGSAAEAGSEHSPDPELSPSVELSSGAEAVPAVRILRAQFWRRLIAWGNRFGMQVYLWHMSVVIVLIGGLGWLAQAVSGVPHLAEFVLPAVGSGWWWVSRPIWLLVVMGLSAAVAMAAAWIPFPSESRLAAAGSAIAGFVRELRGNRNGTRLGAAVDERARVAVMRPQARAVIAVGAATVGIAIALLAGVEPLVWTLIAIGLLMGSLTVSAGLDS
jgi:hypothetical protein